MARTAKIYDLSKSIAARDFGMALVMGRNPHFCKQYADFIENLPNGWIGQNEDIRMVWPYDEPHHHNCWSANWGAAVKRGWLVPLPDIERMRIETSHARKTHLHVRVWTW